MILNNTIYDLWFQYLHLSVTAPPSITSTLSSALSAALTVSKKLTAANRAITAPGLRWIIFSGSEWSPVTSHYSPLRTISSDLLSSYSCYLVFIFNPVLPQLFFWDATDTTLSVYHLNKLAFLEKYCNSKQVDEVFITTPVSAVRCVCSLWRFALGCWSLLRWWLETEDSCRLPPPPCPVTLRSSDTGFPPPLWWPHLKNTGVCVTSNKNRLSISCLCNQGMVDMR